MAGKLVYISRAPTDVAVCEPLLAALDAWEVRYSVLPLPYTGSGLPASARQAINDCEVFLRVCTRNTLASPSMQEEAAYFTTLQTQAHGRGQHDRRTLISLILDAAYVRQPFDSVTLFIDTANKTRPFWLNELARPLGVATTARRLSRRSAVGLLALGAATLATGGAAATLFVRNLNAEAANRASNNVLGAGSKLAGQVAWTIDLQQKGLVDVSPLTYTPLVTVAQFADTIYAVTDNKILAITPDQQVQWTFDKLHNMANDSVLPRPSADHDSIVVVNGEPDPHDPNKGTNYLSVVSVHTPLLRWQKAVLEVGPVVLDTTNLYCVMWDTDQSIAVRAFDAQTGTARWATPIQFDTTPGVAVASRRLYVGSAYHFMCLDTKDGKQLWSYSLNDGVIASPVIQDGIVYFGTTSGDFYALDAQTGKRRWSYALNTGVIAAAVVVNHVVYVGDTGGYLWAFDAQHGGLYWRIFAGTSEADNGGSISSQIYYQPVVYKNVIVALAGGTVSAFDLIHGAPRWSITISGTNGTLSAATGPVLVHGSHDYFVVGNNQNQILAINP